MLVVGFGNSAMDIACETSRVSEMTYLSTRRGGWVIPKYLGDKPVDEIGSQPQTADGRMPLWMGRLLYEGARSKKATGDMEAWGLPKPDHKLARGAPDDLVGAAAADRPRAREGEAEHRRAPSRATASASSTASVEQIDKIVYCTGYKITFPFLRPELVDPGP